MDFIINALSASLRLIVSLDAELMGIVLLSLKVSGLAITIASFFGVLIALLLDTCRFPGKNIAVTIMNTSMGLPPVVAGLFLYLLLSRSGPFGFLQILYTPAAMVIAQIALAAPIIAGLTYAVTVSANPSLRLAASSLGATQFQVSLKLIRDARYSVLAAVLAGLGRIMAEVGAVLIVGGNIAGYTRVMTTAIALEADKGDFELAVALGMILLAISFAINGAMYVVQKKGTGA